MDPAALLQRHKGMALNIGLIIISLAVANAIYRNQTKEVESLRQQKETELKKNAELGAISQLQNKFASYKKALTPQDAGAAINTLSSLAQQCGVKIVSIRPLDALRATDYIDKLPVDLVVSCPGYHALGEFISSVESSSGAYTVDAIEVRKEAQAEGLTAYLKISSLALKD